MKTILSMKSTLEPHRWPGGPPICEETNLPAFRNAQDAQASGHTVGRNYVKEVWPCKACRLWHADYLDHPPSGASSGSSRIPWPKSSIAYAKSIAIKDPIEQLRQFRRDHA